MPNTCKAHVCKYKPTYQCCSQQYPPKCKPKQCCAGIIRGKSGRDGAKGSTLYYIIDAGTEAQNIILPPAVPTGAPIIYNIVNTSSGATISPQPGESITGIIDQILDLSVYPDGTQLMFTPQTGDWSIVSLGVSVAPTVETLVFKQDQAFQPDSFFVDINEANSFNSGSLDPDSEFKYSILDQLETFRRDDNTLRFKIIYFNNIGDVIDEAVWEQDSNPVTSDPNVVIGFNLLSGATTDPLFGGLSTFGPAVGNKVFYQGYPSSGAFWWTVGTNYAFNTVGMPGPENFTAISVKLYAVTGGEDTVPPPVIYPNNSSPEEIWLKIGQSNSVGFDGSGPIDYMGEDAVNSRVYEFSQGIDKSTYIAAPAGQNMLYRNPAQDDLDGIGFGQVFGKTRVILNESIEKLIVINRGVGGTGFSSNRWNPGDDLYNLAVADLVLALQNNPNARFKGILWHQGENDAGEGQAFYETSLKAMVDGIRQAANEAAPGRVDGIFILGTMVESWIASDEANNRPIDHAHRNVENYINNGYFVDFKEITDLQDSIHFSTASLREMGKLYAERLQNIVYTSPIAHHMKVVNGEIVDLFGGGGTIGASIPGDIVNDGTRGDVVNTTVNGLSTSLVINPDAYTKSCWVNVIAGPPPFTLGHLFSGSLNVDGTNAHYLAWEGFGHTSPTPPAGPTASNVPLRTEISVGVWSHVVLTWNGTEFRLYIDGVPNGSNPHTVKSFPLSHPQAVALGRLSTSGVAPLNALVDNVILLPYAASDAEVTSLYNLST